MGRKCLCLLGVAVLVFAFTSCSSKPEEGLLKSYFHALMLNDTATLSTMAVEPVSIEADSWKIVQATETVTELAFLPGLNQTELDLKKKMDDHIGPTLDAKDDLDLAQDELKRARTGGARAAAQRKINTAQEAYDLIYEEHKQLQKDYNDAKVAASREEEITKFSLGAGDLPNVRALTGDVHSKQVEVEATKDGQTKSYRFYIRQYTLRDEEANLSRNGRWIVTRIEPIL